MQPWKCMGVCARGAWPRWVNFQSTSYFTPIGTRVHTHMNAVTVETDEVLGVCCSSSAEKKERERLDTHTHTHSHSHIHSYTHTLTHMEILITRGVRSGGRESVLTSSCPLYSEWPGQRQNCNKKEGRTETD